MWIAHTELLLQIIDGYIGLILNAENHFYYVKTALSGGVIECILIFFVITLRLYSKFERKFDHYRHYLQ